MKIKSKYLNIIIITIKVIKLQLNKSTGGDTIKRKSLYICMLALCMVLGGLFFGTPNSQSLFKDSGSNLVRPSSAVATSEQNVNAESKAQKSGIISVSAVCSCSLYTSGATQRKSWENYCPKCYKYGTLVFERTGDCPEGMVRCTSCDADYCAVHGKEHINYGAPYLRPA